ncbi:NAD(P)/FAD-dependent oxidoreductase [Dechloromonas denitrificans]|uniref:NAD(P)-binding protein n=1 Tax=Dechloromonas denitrificans TaxID=281362 RepID=UPI001CF7ED44|nr:NAD(P)/FAD-dependent oxidoreductase [Dechloromonas denitrificans]UCV04225.1 FAD-dependent oxidoreductase [Dechloromonas denitrificans]UCV08513.1 FAD-dependent oxidoreductase [Dechloromonas denitrificans]
MISPIKPKAGTSRRDFLRTVGAAALAGCAPVGKPPLPPGQLLGMAHALGHRLRDGHFPAPSEVRKTGVLIVGGGISGLSAAWQLNKAAVDDFLVLEMEGEAGGNSRAGQSPLVAYPWGAHYLPLPGPEATSVRELLAELGVLQGDPAAAKPTYDERFLCATPQERVYRHGLWDDGLLPQRGVDAAEREQQRRFQTRMEELKAARGRDGRRVFAIPMALSSRDPEWRALDRLSFSQWLADHGFTAPTLRWLANYACRDDYGTACEQTSAWAGLHYFACRNGQAANATSDAVLTAPDGNAWLMRGLARHAAGRLLTEALVWRIAAGKSTLAVDVLVGDKTVRFEARQLIWAAPAFVLPRVWPAIPAELRAAALAGDYAPWLTANLHLADFPEERHGAAPAWDNVLYDSPGLGYVVATHQLIRRHLRGTVFTYYRALHEVAPAEGRRLLLETPREAWAEGILAELEGIHPDIRRLTTRLDVFRNGHAMRRPVPGSLWGGARAVLAAFDSPRLTLAHADLSGFSLFEEAQYRGVVAAQRVIRKMRSG